MVAKPTDQVNFENVKIQIRSLDFALNSLERTWNLQCSPRDMATAVELKFRRGEGLPAWEISGGA